MKNYPGRDHDNFEECVSGKKPASHKVIQILAIIKPKLQLI